MLYTIGFIAVLASAIFWLFLKTKSLASASFFGKSFWISLLLYVLGLYFEDTALLIKLFLMLPIDVAVFISILLLFNRYVTKSKIGFSIIAAILLAIKFFFFDIATNGWEWLTKNITQETEQPQLAVNLADNAELLIDLNAKHPPSELLAKAQTLGVMCRPAFPNVARPNDTSLDEFYVVDIPSERLPEWEDIAQAFQSAGLIDGFEANEAMKIELPNTATPTRGKQPSFGLNDPGVAQLWGFGAMQIQELFALLSKIQPQKMARIAILDTGVDGTHEDLQANFHSTNPQYDTDPLGHGTHCAGIAAAVSNNGKGIASFAPNNNFVRVTSIRVLNSFGGGTQQDIINGIIEAADQGADVISLSLGGPSFDHEQRAYAEAIRYAHQAGAIVVAAAGNANDDAANFAPANVKGIIAVAALDEQLHKAEFSNHVRNLAMPIAAPGVNIYATFPNNEYKVLSGTSMATPYVAGLLGVMKAIQPNLTAEQAYQLLQQTAAEVPDAQDTGKLIQPGKAVAALLALQNENRK
ncbi:MAG: S8 family serine peptidase [Cytophagales bacterium]|nr:S8 family serine peptidase [Bernardetiaceae bacterium]MDW8203521.1 S8 family serine peptidase [Cytophagales bacterium]